MFAYPTIIPQTIPKSTNTKTSTQCKWVGTIRSTVNLYGYIETLAGTVIYERDTSELDGNYILTGGNLTWSASGTSAAGCTVTGGPLTFEIVYSVPEETGALVFGDYYGGSGMFLRILNELVTFTCPNYIEYGMPTLYLFNIGGREEDTIWGNGVISGSIEQTVGGASSSHEWNLHLEGADTKLSVESDEYDHWLPTAGKDEKEAGKEIEVRAQLLEADGTTACAIADSFKFELINVSHEPGIALNFPDENKAEKDWDLHFIQVFNAPDDVMSSDRLSLVTKGGSEAVALIPSFDWGAYGKLKVTAFTYGGKIITGFLKGHPEITEIPIPKRSGTSKIADKWKKDNGVTALDDDDSENEPVGDGHAGDGFTLYEEYRGFYENGEHIFGDPKRKDLFVYKELDDFNSGIQLFAALTKLKVHYKLNTSEFDTKKRMMNFNYLDAPHWTDQHGLWLKKHVNRSSSHIGPPKYSDTVNISAGAFIWKTFLEGSRKEITDELSSTVAHELGHAVRMPHHGENIDQKNNTYSHVYSYNGSTNAFELEITENNSVVIDPRWENDSSYTQSFDGEHWIGVWGGQHSGVEDCIMRYDCAFGNIPGPGMTSNIRYITDQERTGIILCDKKDGTGVNDNNRSPRPRYGPAVNGRCKFQICVNDEYH
jgi:hypothetical protein